MIFKDVVTFWKITKRDEKRVICLTATPDDGYVEGVERKIVQMMGYQEIISEKKQDFKMPDIHAYAKLKDETDVMD